MRKDKNDKNFTLLLNKVSEGDNFALERILPLVYEELRMISSKYLRDEYRKHTFQTTELVHEAYIKLIGSENLTWESRGHFFGIAARSMRQILVDHARKRKAQKRGLGQTKLSLDKAEFMLSDTEEDILNLNEALNKLEKAFAKVDYVHGRQYEKAAKCAIQIGDDEKGFLFAKKAAVLIHHNFRLKENECFHFIVIKRL